MLASCRRAAARPNGEQHAALEADSCLRRGEDVRDAERRARLERLSAKRVDETVRDDAARRPLDREERDQLPRLAPQRALATNDVNRGSAELRVDVNAGIGVAGEQ